MSEATTLSLSPAKSTSPMKRDQFAWLVDEDIGAERADPGENHDQHQIGDQHQIDQLEDGKDDACAAERRKPDRDVDQFVKELDDDDTTIAAISPR